MRKHFKKLQLIGSALVLIIVSSSVAFALPPQANAHAQAANNNTHGTTSNQASDHQPASTGQSAGQAHLAAAQLQACQNRESAINNIMSRINTRAQNQLTLFSTIATRVESFYASSNKTISNYPQLTSAVDSAKTQAQTDLGALQANNTLSCTANNPKGVVTAFQSYLKTEIADLQNYRTAVKNLIVAVAQANGVSVSTSNQSTNSQGGQQ